MLMLHGCFVFCFFFGSENFYSNLSNKWLYLLYISGLQLNSENKKNKKI